MSQVAGQAAGQAVNQTADSARPASETTPSLSVGVLFVLLQAALVALCLLVIGTSLPEPDDRYALRHAVRLATDGSQQRVTLPGHFHGELPQEIDLRMTFTAPARPGEDWSIFTPRFTNAAQFMVNGAVVLDTRRIARNNRMNVNAPDLAVIPAQLLRSGANELQVRLLVWGPLGGFLDTVFVGPDDALRPAYDRRVTLFETLPVIFSAWQMILAVVLGIMWFKRRQETAYGVLALAMALGVLHTFLIPSAHPSWLAGIRAALIGSAPVESGLLLIFCALFLGYRMRRSLQCLVLAPGMIMVAAGIAGGPEAVRWTFLFLGMPAIFLCLTSIVWMTFRSALQRRDLISILLACASTVLITCVVWDLMTIAGVLTGQRIFVSRMAYAAVLAAIGACLTWRFASVLNEVDSFAGRLVQQVHEAENKLRASFARDEQRQRAAALANERTRLTRDLHDGLGGQLMSIVALAERNEVNGVQIGEAARSALRDLRLVIDAMDDIDGDLMLALGAWRERTTARLRPHDIQLEWRALSADGQAAGELPRHEELRPWHVIQLLRLLDEAVTNTVKHANARCITVSFGAVADPDGAARGRIIIADDGHGFRTRDTQGAPGHGRGLENMRRRADRCGVVIIMDSRPDGLRIVLDLPQRFPDAENGS